MKRVCRIDYGSNFGMEIIIMKGVLMEMERVCIITKMNSFLVINYCKRKLRNLNEEGLQNRLWIKFWYGNYYYERSFNGDGEGLHYYKNEQFFGYKLL